MTAGIQGTQIGTLTGKKMTEAGDHMDDRQKVIEELRQLKVYIHNWIDPSDSATGCIDRAIYYIENPKEEKTKKESG